MMVGLLIKFNHFLSDQLLSIKNILRIYEIIDFMVYVRILVSLLDFDFI